MNRRPSGYEPDELPGCSTPQQVGGNLAAWLGVSRKNLASVESGRRACLTLVGVADILCAK